MPPSRVLLTAVIVLSSMVDPGAPKMTMPPSVALVMVLSSTRLSPHPIVMPSDQALLVSVPASWTWLPVTVAPSQVGPPLFGAPW
ncbi:MAG TPA: hypothetical protein VH478_10430 [Trebonia sp.]|nr:hypothetical protein [Trebonia sp.]